MAEKPKDPRASGIQVELPPADPRYEVQDDQIREAMLYLATMIDVAIKAGTEGRDKRLGFALFIFEFDGPAMFYVSNGQRQDVAKALREWIQREAGH